MARSVVNLGGSTWRLGQAPDGAVPERAAWAEMERVAEWLPAVVPGNVQADLLRAGRVPDPAVGCQNERLQWVDDHCWWLARDFAWDVASPPDRRAHLVLRGVDYIGDVFLNGQHLGRHEGMFSPQVYEVTDLLGAENRLAVRILGSRWLPADRSGWWDRLLSRLEGLVAGAGRRFPQRRDTLKCQMSFGWDFAPPLRAMGIWDEVYIVASRDVLIRQVIAKAEIEANQARLHVHLDIDARRAARVRIRCRLAGETFDGESIVVEQDAGLNPGPNGQYVAMAVSQPRLWWPWDQGRPDLYRLRVEVLAGEQALDSYDELVGLRQVHMEGRTLVVNGRRVYARGANWVPADVLPGRVTEADYRALLGLARDANMNMLRVWGGGLREKQPFYELCDRLGIMVWQEFPVACAFMTRYPRGADYIRLVEAEAAAIIGCLRNHPSVVLWCGGNEFIPRRNAPLVQALARAAAGDETRPFLSASPHEGDSHNWHVWHEYQPPAAYRADHTGFASEFGLQAPPSVEALRRFIPAGELWPPGPSWVYHNAGLAKLRRYARPFLGGGERSLEAFVRASQRAQAHGLQIAIEHYRRSKAEGCGGTLVWQLNEPWPAISWSLIDYGREPKPAYHSVARLFSPVLVSADYAPQPYQAGDPFHAEVWIVNDLARALPGCTLEVALHAGPGDGRAVHALSEAIDVAADSAAVVSRVCWTLPEGEGRRLACRLVHEGRVVAANDYDLTAYDGLGPSRAQRLATWLGRAFIPT